MQTHSQINLMAGVFLPNRIFTKIRMTHSIIYLTCLRGFYVTAAKSLSMMFDHSTASANCYHKNAHFAMSLSFQVLH